MSSFTIDKKILNQFEKSIPKYSKSQTIENLIKQFLKEKKSEKPTPSQTMVKSIHDTNLGADSNNV